MTDDIIQKQGLGVTVELPRALVSLFPGARTSVEVDAANVADMLEALDRLWPGMRHCLRDSRPSIRRHINIFVDGERAGLGTPLKAGSTVFILTAMSGG